MNTVKKLLVLTMAAVLAAGCGNQQGQDNNAGNGNPSGNTSGIKTPAGEEREMKNERIDPEDFSQALLSGEFERAHRQMSGDMKEIVTLEQLQGMMEPFHEEMDRYVQKSHMSVNGAEHYVWTDEAESRGLLAIFDGEQTIVGMQAIPLQSNSDTDEQLTQGLYSLPFEDEWLVFWGGNNVLINYHYAHPTQRYAIDLVQVKDNQTYEGDPALNESYYAFGQPVLAPADGVIVDVVNDIVDNTPGVMNEQAPAGNHVVIDHGNGEFSMLAHFKQGSITHQAGDRVAKGDVLGQCGNSGNSSEAHIHYQVMDGKQLDTAYSMPIRHEGEPVMIQGELVRGK